MVKTQWKISKAPARARMKLLELDAKDSSGRALMCECKSPLDAYDLLREMERPKPVLCCRNPKCGNSAKATARMFGATLFIPEEAQAR